MITHCPQTLNDLNNRKPALTLYSDMVNMSKMDMEMCGIHDTLHQGASIVDRHCDCDLLYDVRWLSAIHSWRVYLQN